MDAVGEASGADNSLVCLVEQFVTVDNFLAKEYFDKSGTVGVVEAEKMLVLVERDLRNYWSGEEWADWQMLFERGDRALLTFAKVLGWDEREARSLMAVEADEKEEWECHRCLKAVWTKTSLKGRLCEERRTIL